MTDDELSVVAKEEMDTFAKWVVADLQEFADEHKYEFDWCVDRFRTAFTTALKKRTE